MLQHWNGSPPRPLKWRCAWPAVSKELMLVEFHAGCTAQDAHARAAVRATSTTMEWLVQGTAQEALDEIGPVTFSTFTVAHTAEEEHAWTAVTPA